MKKLFLKTALFLIPVLLFILLYVVIDPFKVIRDHNSYAPKYVMLHRGFVSTKLFLKNEPKYHFNSFIFGSSTSCSHTSREWEKYLQTGDRAFSFGSWEESINGIYGKIKLIDQTGSKIKNALLIIDVGITFNDNDAFKFDHYKVSGLSPLDFHYRYFKNFLSLNMIISSIDYSFFHTKRSYMNKFIGMNDKNLDPINNDWMINSNDELKDSATYYKNSLSVFYTRPLKQQICQQQISENKLEILKKIQAIFTKHHTNCIIVISPLYNQVKLNPSDLKVLQQVFGASHVYDYSGINNITSRIINYSRDLKHYKKTVGNIIFNDIYSQQIRTASIFKPSLPH